MRLKINLIPDLPSTTYEEAVASLAEIRALSDCLQEVSVFPFEPTRSSNVGRHPERFGLVTAPASGAVGADPAMTAPQRADVYRQYRRFAAEIHRRNSPTRPINAHLDIDAPVRVPVEELDVFQTGDHLVCTQIRSRKRVTISGAAARLLAPHVGGSAFSLAEFTDDADARALAHNLDAAGILVPASNDSCERVVASEVK